MAEDFTGFPAEELRKFSESGQVIAGAMGTSIELWARSEAGVILKAWAGRTKVTTEKKAERRALMHAYRQSRKAVGFWAYKGGVEPGEASINLGIRGAFGRVWYRVPSAGRPRFVLPFANGFAAVPREQAKICASDFSKVQAFAHDFKQIYRAMVDAAKGAVGFSRQSIIQIADDLNIDLLTVKGGGTLSAAGIAKARAALASNGQPYRNGYGIISKTAREFYVTLVNRYPKAGYLFMDQTLRQVIAGRIAYFQRNCEEATFLSAKATAKAYPYLEVLRLAA